MANITLLIPFYNEGKRILKVLDQMIQIPEIDQIICVDDGSTDNIYEIIQENYEVNVIRSFQNRGKSAAVKLGMNHVENDWVFLSDADLCQIKVEEFRLACHYIKHEMIDGIDMIVFRRMKAPWFVKYDRGDILFSGERILKSSELRVILNNKVEHYQLEIAINQWMLDHDKHVCWLPSSVTNTYKFQKLGLYEGLTKEFRMWYNLVNYIGVKNYLRQIRKFATTTIPSSINGSLLSAEEEYITNK
ncbi:glycosyltransferase [Catalinimonas niigatensis]|uniref:glycosyltransferase n=1 Tax=Catalinimonas niigatensis TaxID=1397264 RepID=UPI0026651D0B|nr:glycosyltransferase [Catalinimonas niigatensis]WPP51884.1 glycosyltransferase [Catalinimonas niigatensis]